MSFHCCLYCGHWQRVSRSHRHFQTVLRGQRGQGLSSAAQARYGSTAWPYKPPLGNHNAKCFPFTALLAQNLPCSCTAQCGDSVQSQLPARAGDSDICVCNHQSNHTVTPQVHPQWHNWKAPSLLSPLSHLFSYIHYPV